MVILIILASIVVPKMTGYSEKARKSKAISEIAAFKTALQAFEIDCGRFPHQRRRPPRSRTGARRRAELEAGRLHGRNPARSVDPSLYVSSARPETPRRVMTSSPSARMATKAATTTSATGPTPIPKSLIS